MNAVARPQSAILRDLIALTEYMIAHPHIAWGVQDDIERLAFEATRAQAQCAVIDDCHATLCLALRNLAIARNLATARDHAPAIRNRFAELAACALDIARDDLLRAIEHEAAR